MPVTNLDRLEAMLAAVCPADLAVLSPAERRRLDDAAYRVHLLAEQAAGGKPFPAVRPAEPLVLTIQDESMAPRFLPGEEVVIDPKVPPRDNPDDPDFVLVRLTTGQVVFRQYVPKGAGNYDLVGLHKDCRTRSVTPSEPAELLGTMVEHRWKRRRGARKGAEPEGVLDRLKRGERSP
jgi:hypothetical protein